MKYDIILQARCLSSRLPGKMFLELGEKTVLENLIHNLKKKKIFNRIILAVPFDKFSVLFENIAKSNKINFFSSKQVKENDLLSRFYYSAKKFRSKNIIRITPDCPFINIEMVKKMLKIYENKKLLYLTNNKPKRHVPHGFDCEIFNFSLLEKAYKNAKKKYDREHVTPYIYDNYFTKKVNFFEVYKKDYSKIRITLDSFEDYFFLKKNYFKLRTISLSKNPEKLLKFFI